MLDTTACCETQPNGTGTTHVACTIVDVSSDGFRLTVPRGVPCGGGYRLIYSGEEHEVVVMAEFSGPMAEFDWDRWQDSIG